MVSLRSPNTRFWKPIKFLEGAIGLFKGIIDEPNQGTIPSYQFTDPRRLLRVRPGQIVPVGSVIQSESGHTFLVGTLGVSEEVFDSYRLFEVNRQYSWTRRTPTTDLVTGLSVDPVGTPTNLGMIWAAYEPTPEQFDRQIRGSFETGRMITNRPVILEDIIDNKRVTRVDPLLGVNVISVG